MWTTCCAYSSTKLANLIECAKVFIDELLGEVLSEEGGKGGGGEMGGGEAEDLDDFFARIVVGALSKLKSSVAIVCSRKGKWVPMDHSKSKEGLSPIFTPTAFPPSLSFFSLARFANMLLMNQFS